MQLRTMGILISCLGLSVCALAIGRVWPAAKVPSLIVSFALWIVGGITLCVFGIRILVERQKSRR
jgi:hypothetical protein